MREPEPSPRVFERGRASRLGQEVPRQFLEVVAPTMEGTTAGRLLHKRGGDGGYSAWDEQQTQFIYGANPGGDLFGSSNGGQTTVDITLPSTAGAPGVFFKALTTREQIAEAVATVLREHPVAELRSELRAHLNPTRLRHIRRLAMRLANRLRTGCPSCAAPGFGEPLPRPGLPCAACGFPTSVSSGPAWQCQACQHIEHRKRGGKADPAFCPMCNR